ncbi:MAG: PilZ domain-containing protein, partial [Acidobacteriota bacterium]
MDSTDAVFNPSRQATRAPVNLLVRLELDGPLGETVEARCNNISIGGMFVLTEMQIESGQQMRFELDVADAGTVRGLAEVVWCQPASDRRPAGLGFKFRYLEQRDRQLIFKLVSRHIKDRLASRPAPPPPAPQPSGPTPTLLTPPEAQAGPPAFAISGPPPAPEPPAPPAPPAVATPAPPAVAAPAPPAVAAPAPPKVATPPESLEPGPSSGLFSMPEPSPATTQPLPAVPSGGGQQTFESLFDAGAPAPPVAAAAPADPDPE